MENLPRNATVKLSSNHLLRCGYLALLLLCSSTLTVLAAPHQAVDSSKAMDKQTAAILAALANGELQTARLLSRQMAWRFPKYALAQLLTAELESAAAFQDVKAANQHPISQELIDLLAEAQVRLKAIQKNDALSNNTTSQVLSTLPDTVVQIGNTVSNLLIADLEQSTIRHIVGNDLSHILIRKHYISSGKGGFGKQIEGDNKTPLGVYTINAKRSDASLPDLYGAGALTLNYPNALDRHMGRTGYGIWIHGVPHAQRSRAPRSSEGCVTMSNDHIASLMNQVDPKDTLVILTTGLSFATQDDRSERQRQYQQLFTRFQKTLLTGSASDIAKLYDNPKEGHIRGPHSSLINQVSRIKARDLTIIMNPSLPVYQHLDSRFLVMKGKFGPKNQYLFTLYWREMDNGQWRVTAEEWNSPST